MGCLIGKDRPLLDRHEATRLREKAKNFWWYIDPHNINRAVPLLYIRLETDIIEMLKSN